MSEQKTKIAYPQTEGDTTANLTLKLLEGLKEPHKYPNAFVEGVPFGFTKGIPIDKAVSKPYSDQFQQSHLLNANHLLFTPDGVFHVTSPTRIAIDPLTVDINPVLHNTEIAGTTFPITENCVDTLTGQGSPIGVRKLDFSKEADTDLTKLILSETNTANPPVVAVELTAENLLEQL